MFVEDSRICTYIDDSPDPSHSSQLGSGRCQNDIQGSRKQQAGDSGSCGHYNRQDGSAGNRVSWSSISGVERGFHEVIQVRALNVIGEWGASCRTVRELDCRRQVRTDA